MCIEVSDKNMRSWTALNDRTKVSAVKSRFRWYVASNDRKYALLMFHAHTYVFIGGMICNVMPRVHNVTPYKNRTLLVDIYWRDQSCKYPDSRKEEVIFGSQISTNGNRYLKRRCRRSERRPRKPHAFHCIITDRRRYSSYDEDLPESAMMNDYSIAANSGSRVSIICNAAFADGVRKLESTSRITAIS